jgi:hypothetical protein
MGDGTFGTMFGSLTSGKGFIQQQRFDGNSTVYDLLLQPNGGNVGIGITNPTLNPAFDTVLHIHSTSGSLIKLTDDTSGSGVLDGFEMIQVGTTSYLTNRENGAINFATNGTQALSIASNQAATFASSVTANTKVRIEAVAPYLELYDTGEAEAATITYEPIPTWVRFSEDIKVEGTGYFDANVRATDGIFSGDTFFGTTGTPNGTSVYGSVFQSSSDGRALLLQASSTTLSTNLQGFFNPNGLVGTISTSGSTTSYNTSSDYRLKEDLKDFNGLEMISNIPVYDYKWKVDESRSYGVMAHELQEVLPNAVSGEKDAEEMQGVDYSKIVPLLIKSIQELKEEIEILKKK